MKFTFIAFLVLSLLSIAAFPLKAVVVIQDDFTSGTSAVTGAAVLPGTNWGHVGTVSRDTTAGTLTLRTTEGGAQWNGSTLHTTVAPSQLNLFQNTITISIRDLAITGVGDHANPNTRFRFGLMPRDSETYSGESHVGSNSFREFYNNGNDGLAVNLRTSATTGTTMYEIMTKSNTTKRTDPNNLRGSDTLNFLAQHVDLTVNATSWNLKFWNDTGEDATYTGTWDLASFENSWGNASDGWGNSGFIMGMQQMGGMGISDPIDSYNGYGLVTVGSVLVTSVPEPHRSVLAFLALTCLGFKRRR